MNQAVAVIDRVASDDGHAAAAAKLAADAIRVGFIVGPTGVGKSAAAMALALVYLGEHYVLDVLVGLGVTGYACAMSERWDRVGARRARRPPQPKPRIASDAVNPIDGSAEARMA